MADSEIIFSVWKSREGGYEAQALGYDIFAQAETMDDLKSNVEDAVRCHFGEGCAPMGIRLVEANRKRGLGSAKGEFTVPDDFNDADPEIEALFYEGDIFPREDVSGK